MVAFYHTVSLHQFAPARTLPHYASALMQQHACCHIDAAYMQPHSRHSIMLQLSCSNILLPLSRCHIDAAPLMLPHLCYSIHAAAFTQHACCGNMHAAAFTQHACCSIHAAALMLLCSICSILSELSRISMDASALTLPHLCCSIRAACRLQHSHLMHAALADFTLVTVATVAAKAAAGRPGRRRGSGFQALPVIQVHAERLGRSFCGLSHVVA